MSNIDWFALVLKLFTPKSLTNEYTENAQYVNYRSSWMKTIMILSYMDTHWQLSSKNIN